jgi:hypothetical protein
MKAWMELFRLAREEGQDEASLQLMERLVMEAGIRREPGQGLGGANGDEERVARGAWGWAQEEFLRGDFVEDEEDAWEDQELLDLAADDGGMGEQRGGGVERSAARYVCEGWLLEWRGGRLRKREGPEGLSVEWSGEWVGLMGQDWAVVEGDPPGEFRAMDARGRRKVFRLEE